MSIQNTQLYTLLLNYHFICIHVVSINPVTQAYDNNLSPNIFGQTKHLSGQMKFGQANLLYIINREIIEFAEEYECLDNLQSLTKALLCVCMDHLF